MNKILVVIGILALLLLSGCNSSSTSFKKEPDIVVWDSCRLFINKDKADTFPRELDYYDFWKEHGEYCMEEFNYTPKVREDEIR